MKLFKHLIVLLFTVAMVLVTTDAFAAKYKSSSSRSSFSSRPVSRPAPAAPKPQPYVRPSTPSYNTTSSSSSKYTSSSSSASSRTNSSASSLYSNKQAQQKSASSYATMNTPKPVTPAKPYDYKQAKPAAVTSSYGKPQQSTTYSQSRTPTNTHTVIVKERGVDMGDVIVGAMVANALTNTASANTANATNAATNQQVTQLQREVQELKAAAVTAPGPVPVDKSTLPTLKFCAGPQNLNYYNYATILHHRAKQYNVEIVTTNGSGDNLQKIHNGECDAGIVQRDSYEEYGKPLSIHRISSPYSDEAILMCTASSGITKISEIRENTMVAALPATSGASGTWHKVVSVYNISPRYMSVDNTRDQLMALNGGKADCAFMVTTRSAPVFDIGRPLKLNEKVRTVHIPYTDFKDVKDPSGEVMYYESTLNKLRNFNYSGYGSFLGFSYKKAANTFLVPNDVIVSDRAMKLPYVDNLINDIDSIKL